MTVNKHSNLGYWSDEELLPNIEEMLGKPTANQIDECIESINSRNIFLDYHFSEITRLLEDDGRREIEDVCQRNRQNEIGARPRDEISDFRSRRNICTDISAHVYSFIQNKHAVIDMLCYVICTALEFTPPNGNFKNLNFTSNKLNEAPSNDSSFHDLKQRLNDITGFHEFNYLKEIVNTSKHQRLIKIEFCDPNGKFQNPRFEAFDKFPEKDVITFLRAVYDKNNTHLIRVGNSLNALVAKRFNDRKQKNF